MSLADRIQSLRKAKSISQEELADKLGVSRQAVSKWESEQSIPDVEKIIILSDFFEVTTDYLLKGIESEKQTAPETDAKIFAILATALNFIGLLASCAIIYPDYKDPIAVIIGLIIFAVGGTVFGIGQTISNKSVAIAKRYFWIINIWLLTLIPLSALYNIIFALPLAPYPLMSRNQFALPVFFAVYIAICLCVVFLQIKSNHRRTSK